MNYILGILKRESSLLVSKLNRRTISKNLHGKLVVDCIKSRDRKLTTISKIKNLLLILEYQNKKANKDKQKKENSEDSE